MLRRVALVGEAAQVGDLDQGEVGVHEQPFRLFHPALDDVPVGREARRDLERARKWNGLMHATAETFASVRLRARFSST